MRIILLVGTLLCSCLSKTQHDGKAPGWRPDRPDEDGIVIVQRMQRKLQRQGIPQGEFFTQYKQWMTGLAKALDSLTPATLMPAEMHAELDDETLDHMQAATTALKWQQQQVECWRRHNESMSRATGPKGRTKAVDAHLVESGVLDARHLRRMPEAKRGSVSKDLEKLQHIFLWTEENMPDEDEAVAISHALNAAEGYPPPSQRPPAPPPPPGARRDEL